MSRFRTLLLLFSLFAPVGLFAQGGEPATPEEKTELCRGIENARRVAKWPPCILSRMGTIPGRFHVEIVEVGDGLYGPDHVTYHDGTVERVALP